MNFTDALDILKKSNEFEAWEKDHPDAFFSYAFAMGSEAPPETWQLGYFNKKDDALSTFSVSKDAVTLEQGQEAFKKPDTEVQPIDLEQATLNHETIIQKLLEFKQEKAPTEPIMKIISILQHNHGYGTVWNMTILTQSFKTVNIKIDPSTGEILHHSVENFMSFDGQ